MFISCRGNVSFPQRFVGALVVTVLVGSVAGVVVMAGSAGAQSVELCNVGDSVQFSDVADSDYGAAHILCIKALGLSAGKGDGSYGPNDELTRAQMASFLVRLWRDVLSRRCPSGASSPFVDVSGSSPHALNIDCLYELGITQGTSPTTYEPSVNLTASQISRFLLRLWLKLGNSCDPADSEIAQAGVCLTRLRVTPSAAEARSGKTVTRAQMAVYIVGLWYNAAGRGTPPVPPTRPADGTISDETCGLSRVGDWFYQTWESPEDGVAHSWSLPSSEVSWERPGLGVGNDCWWDAGMSLVCWEDSGWYYSIFWDDVGQVEYDENGYTYAYVDSGDSEIAWEDWLSVEVTTTGQGDVANIWLFPDGSDDDWTEYVNYSITEEGVLRMLFVETDQWIVFGGTSGWEEVFESCADVLPDAAVVHSQPEACRPGGLNVSSRHDDTTVGFPLPSWAAAATGTLDVAVMFADFPDARASYTTEREAGFGVAEMERYVEAMSGGLLDVRVEPFHGWLTASSGWEEYLEPLSTGNDGIASDIVRETALRAEQEFGFSGADYDSLMVVLPSSRFSGGLAGGEVHIAGAAGATRWSLANNQQGSESTDSSDPREWWFTGAHELMHNLGLADLYPYDQAVRKTPDPHAGTHWVRFEVSLMGLEVNFPAPLDAYPYTVNWPPAYLNQTEYDQQIEAREMLAWSRWQLGWLDENKMVCLIDVDDITVELTSLAHPGTGVTMVAIPHHADNGFVIVVESRRPIGYDHPERVSGSTNDGIPYHYTDYGLPHEGVIVYTVRADRPSGELPLLLWTDPGDGEVDEAPVMQPGYKWWIGQPGTATGQYLIEVLSSSETTDTIRVTFTA